MKTRNKSEVKWVSMISIFLVSIVIASSCTKLDSTDYTQIVANKFTPNSQSVAALVGAAYYNWRVIEQQWNGLWRVQEVSSDEALIPARPNGWVDGGPYRRLQLHIWTAGDDPVLETWNRTYAGITNCNRIIYQIQTGKIPMPKDQATSTIAEMKVLRASYYYILCDLYGNVPIVTKFNVPAGFLPEQSTRDSVYNFVVHQIQDNIQYLSSANDQSTYGRFNKGAAHTLLATMYLNAGVYTGTPEWGKCIAQCDSVINSDNYVLAANEEDDFVTENQNCKEIIFALPMDNKYTTAWNAFDIAMETLEPENQATYNLTQTPWGGICMVPQFINSFNKNDTRYNANFIKGQQYAANGDSLFCTLGASAGQPLDYINYVPSVDSSGEADGWRLGKYEIAMGSTNVLSNDYVVFRYSDILLMKAECLLRTGHPDEAAALVTQVRARDFKDDPAAAVVTGAELMQGSNYDYGMRSINDSTNQGGADVQYGRMLDELGWEFNQEGRRRQDMIRFGVYTTKSWLSHQADNQRVSDPAHLRIFPIPTQALQDNSNLKQNPGY